jgi:hypothetical protein
MRMMGLTYQIARLSLAVAGHDLPYNAGTSPNPTHSCCSRWRDDKDERRTVPIDEFDGGMTKTTSIQRVWIRLLERLVQDDDGVWASRCWVAWCHGWRL